MAALRRWRTDAPLAADLATKKLRNHARRARRKADRRLAAAIETGDGAMLHRARKAAKRARYAYELLRPTGRKAQAKPGIRRYKRIQGVLGDHQDTVVASATLRWMAAGAGPTAGENGFAYGLLYAREQAIAEGCRHQVRKLV
ncbi:MAG: CHAD domain-containing protein, partial [Mycolicibacterium sp.]|nr:CHAD domain-containing protein [Mycolicibacterium sp.]